MAANHRNMSVLNVPIGQLVNLLRDSAFCRELNLEQKSENPNGVGVWFRFHHGTTFTSWGEKITITLTPVAEAAVQMEVLSECGMPTQVVDWGKNASNVRAIEEYINKNIYKYAVGAQPMEQPVSPVAPQPMMPPQPVPPVAPQPMMPPQPFAPAQPIVPSQPAAPAMFCYNCGSQLMPEARFCSRCGAKLF